MEEETYETGVYSRVTAGANGTLLATFNASNWDQAVVVTATAINDRRRVACIRKLP